MLKTDKDRPSTWVSFRDSFCKTCTGECCTMPVEVSAGDLVRLGWAAEEDLERSPKKVAKTLIKEKKITSYRESTGFFMLTAKPNGECFLLDSKTRLCSVYAKRPQTCRSFPEIGPRPGFCPYKKKQ